MYDPATGKFTLIDTCFPTHHLNFAEDANHTLWTSPAVGGPGVIGWLNRKMYEETGDEAKSQGWTPFILDTNGNGKRDAYVEAQPAGRSGEGQADRGEPLRVAVSPADGAVWGTVLGYPGCIVRVAPGDDPTHTALTEIYEPPVPGYGPRGGDVDRNGVYWVVARERPSRRASTAASARCSTARPRPASIAPKAGRFHQLPGPQFRDVSDPGSAEASYYTWVDWFDTFGLGKQRADRDGQPQQLDPARWSTASSSTCACPIRWASSPRTSTAASTIRTPAGRARALWTTYRHPHDVPQSKAARRTGRRRSRSRCGRIRSRTDRAHMRRDGLSAAQPIDRDCATGNGCQRLLGTGLKSGPDPTAAEVEMSAVSLHTIASPTRAFSGTSQRRTPCLIA